ncbi:MAG: histidine kinase [Fibrobacteres bacterium]|nr:histidine kinase [Fibrobacterota bacterium]
MAAKKLRTSNPRTALTGRYLMYRLIWIEGFCFALLVAFISLDDEYLIPKFVKSDFPFSQHAVAGMLDSVGVILLFLLALYIQIKVLNKIRLLEGMLSVCANCKRIHDGKNHWSPIEEYIHERSHADFSHTICPDCGVKLYGDLYVRANRAPGEDEKD